MDALFRNLVVGVIPQPSQFPPAPFDRERLQRAYMEVSRVHPYEQFGFLPADQGAQFLNPPEDRVLVQPGLLQVVTPLESTPERGREKVIAVLRTLGERLTIAQFVQCGVKVVAHVPAPEGGARAFVADRLMSGQQERLEELGPGFFGGGVKYRRYDASARREAVLLIEPLLSDDNFIWIDYDYQTVMPFDDLALVGQTIDEAFDFVRVRAMKVLEEA